MMISEQQKLALFLDIHRAIEEAASEALAQAASPTEFSIAYPPNGGLSEEEMFVLGNLPFSPVLESALRKIIADAASYPIFRLFSLLDGVSDPYEYKEFWPGLTLSPSDEEEVTEDSLLHDDFFGTYWNWRRVRTDPGWKLDNLEGGDY